MFKLLSPVRSKISIAETGISSTARTARSRSSRTVTSAAPSATTITPRMVGSFYISSGTIAWMDEAVGLNVLCGVGVLSLSMLGLLSARDVDNKK